MENKEIPAEWNSKKTWIDVITKPGLLLMVLNIPFLGVYKLLADGNFTRFNFVLLAVSIGFLVLSVDIMRRVKNSKYGYTATTVYFRNLYSNKEMLLKDLLSIESVHDYKEFTWDDLNIWKQKGKRAYRIDGTHSKMIIPQNSHEAHFFAGVLSSKTGIKVKNEPAELLDIIQGALSI